MKTYRILIMLFAGVLALASCKKDEKDDEAPVIGVSEPVNNFSVNTGSEIHFEATFTDNEDLAQYKIDIHNDFDGHTHGKTSEADPWETVIIQNISGKTHNATEHIDVPTDAAAGDYHMIVSCVDASGNEADFTQLEFTIVNISDTEDPVLNITSPTDNQQFNVGDDLVITGTVTDNMEVEEVEIVVERESDETEVADEDIHVHAAQGNINVTVPTAGFSAGHYHIHITATDHVNNQSEVEIEIELN